MARAMPVKKSGKKFQMDELYLCICHECHWSKWIANIKVLEVPLDYVSIAMQ